MLYDYTNGQTDITYRTLQLATGGKKQTYKSNNVLKMFFTVLR